MCTAILLIAMAAEAIGLPSLLAHDGTEPVATPSVSPAHSVAPSSVGQRDRVTRRPLHISHQLSGKASWFSTGRNGHYAAACRPLRRAMGKGWRGKQVLVAVGRRAEIVVLNDWCGSHDKTIDLSDEAFRYFAPLSRGVLKVTVGW